jgi:hypothetical protein
MQITVTDYLDVISSWCFWSEPTWAKLKERYDGRVEFQWKIALMDPSGLPTSREQDNGSIGARNDDAFAVHINTDWDPSRRCLHRIAWPKPPGTLVLSTIAFVSHCLNCFRKR